MTTLTLRTVNVLRLGFIRALPLLALILLLTACAREARLKVSSDSRVF